MSFFNKGFASFAPVRSLFNKTAGGARSLFNKTPGALRALSSGLGSASRALGGAAATGDRLISDPSVVQEVRLVRSVRRRLCSVRRLVRATLALTRDSLPLLLRRPLLRKQSLWDGQPKICLFKKLNKM